MNKENPLILWNLYKQNLICKLWLFALMCTPKELVPLVPHTSLPVGGCLAVGLGLLGDLSWGALALVGLSAGGWVGGWPWWVEVEVCRLVPPCGPIPSLSHHLWPFPLILLWSTAYSTKAWGVCSGMLAVGGFVSLQPRPSVCLTSWIAPLSTSSGVPTIQLSPQFESHLT